MFPDFILVEPFLFQIVLVVIISTRRPELALLNTLMQYMYIHVRAFPLKNHKRSNSKPWFWILILKYVQFFLSYVYIGLIVDFLCEKMNFFLYIFMRVFIEIRHKDQHEFHFKTHFIWIHVIEEAWTVVVMVIHVDVFNELHFNSSLVSKLWQFHTYIRNQYGQTDVV